MERHSARHSLIAVILLVLSFVLAGAGPTAAGQAAPPLELAASAGELSLTKGLAVGLIGLYGRSAVASDLLAWQMAKGTMAEPHAGVVVGKNAKGEDAGLGRGRGRERRLDREPGPLGRLSLYGRRQREAADDDPRCDRVLRRLGQRRAPGRREIRRGLSPPPRATDQGPQRAFIPGRAGPVQRTTLRAAGGRVLHRQGHDPAGPRPRREGAGLGRIAAGQRDGGEAGEDRGSLSDRRTGG